MGQTGILEEGAMAEGRRVARAPDFVGSPALRSELHFAVAPLRRSSALGFVLRASG